MAHAGMALQLALMTWLVSQDKWPPSWIHDVFIPAKNISIVFVIVVWLLIHVFVRWQLRKRRTAAFESAAYLRTLLEWAYASPPENDMKPSKEDQENKSSVKDFLDHLIPIPSASPRRDIGKQGYPKCIVTKWREQEKLGSGATTAEWFLWFASVLMFVIVLLRVA